MKLFSFRRIIPASIKRCVRQFIYRYFYYRIGNQYRKLKHSSGIRYILFGTPEYSNIGDHAIALAETYLFRKLNLENKLIEITQEHLQNDKERVFKNVRDKDIILYTGGGFAGSMYLKSGGGLLREVISRFKDHKIIVFPSTCFYESSLQGEACFQEDIRLWQSCRDLHLFLRDEFSWKRISEYETKNFHVYKTPDMAFLLEYKKSFFRKDVLCILRSDKEKANTIDVNFIKKIIADFGRDTEQCSTHASHNIIPRKREDYVFGLLDKLATAELVVTDRLHGMILAIISNTSFIAIDNISKKLSGALMVFDERLCSLICNEESIYKGIEDQLKKAESLPSCEHNLSRYSSLINCITER